MISNFMKHPVHILEINCVVFEKFELYFHCVLMHKCMYTQVHICLILHVGMCACVFVCVDMLRCTYICDNVNV